MFEDIDKAAENLGNKTGGWVFRRDAAQVLGEAAMRALATLKAHEDESDVDVRSAVHGALGQVSEAVSGVAPATRLSGVHSLEELARACEKAGKREVKPHGEGYIIRVLLKGDRTQAVYVMPFTRKDNVKLIRVYTFCGKVQSGDLGWALRTNVKLAQCAFALMEQEGEEQLALMNCYLASEVTPTEIKVAVKEVAHYGDWVEKKTTGSDDF